MIENLANCDEVKPQLFCGCFVVVSALVVHSVVGVLIVEAVVNES